MMPEPPAGTHSVALHAMADFFTIGHIRSGERARSIDVSFPEREARDLFASDTTFAPPNGVSSSHLLKTFVFSVATMLVLLR
jgi:hypothetical protein